MKRILIFTAFIVGYLIMSLEILGFRLLAPYFGYSIYVSGSLIGLILASLAVGYYLGGWWADRNVGTRIILILLSITSLFLLFDIFFYPLVLKRLADWGVIWGSLAATILIFFVPMVALAAVSPIIIKILSQEQQIGRSVGVIYAGGTVGSLLGTFFTTFVLIPYLGTRLTFYINFFLALIILVVILLLFDWKKVSWLGLIFLISLAGLSPTKLSSNILLETESAYNQIRLVDTEKIIALVLNSQQSTLVQSGYVKEGTLVNLSLVDLFNIGPIITPVKDLLVLGMAGGISVRQHEEFSPQAKIDAVEIDPRIIKIAKDRFGIAGSSRLKIFEADARPFLSRNKKKYDMIEVDLFQGSPYVPFYVLTQEFFQLINSRLNDGGLVLMNIYAPGKKEILDPVLATMNSVFPTIYTIPINNNQVVLATRSKTNSEQIKNQIKKAQASISPELKLVTDYTLTYIKEFKGDKKTPIFTDDWAPVELLTYKMLKNLRL